VCVRVFVSPEPPVCGDDEAVAPSVDCHQYVANAAIHGDAYTWHVDADPSSFPLSPYTEHHGLYYNRVSGVPPIFRVKGLGFRYRVCWDIKVLVPVNISYCSLDVSLLGTP
jgi:hypothetical protein